MCVCVMVKPRRKVPNGWNGLRGTMSREEIVRRGDLLARFLDARLTDVARAQLGWMDGWMTGALAVAMAGWMVGGAYAYSLAHAVGTARPRWM